MLADVHVDYSFSLKIHPVGKEWNKSRNTISNSIQEQTRGQNHVCQEWKRSLAPSAWMLPDNDNLRPSTGTLRRSQLRGRLLVTEPDQWALVPSKRLAPLRRS